MSTDVMPRGLVSRTLPPPSIDGAAGPDGSKMRISRYGDQTVLSMIPSFHALAGEGSYFIATNPTPGTKIDYGSAGTQTSFSDTVPFMVLQNGDSGPTAKRIALQYLKIIQIGGTAPATTTSIQFAAKIDSALRTNTAGTLTSITPVNVNMDESRRSVSTLLVPAGAVATVPAASSVARVVARAQLKGGPTLVLDEYTIIFGSADLPPSGGYLTAVSSYVTRCAPIEIGDGDSCMLHLWLPGGATNPFSFEFEVGLFER